MDNMKSYLAANNELNGKLNDIQAIIEHSGKVNLEKFKSDRQ